ncbi:MAG: EamA/RhaT family transporter [Actinobacteria bacterium]|nr:EamA/RhaT family transporter [Actinomycetota bacterium]
MAVVLALLTAVVYGSADFLGGKATRHVSAIGVTFVGQLFGIAVLGIATLVSDVPAPSATDWAWSALAGVFGSSGLVVFYKAMSSGHMTVAAPTAAVAGAVVPIVVGLSMGERPSVATLVAMPVAIVAIALISDLLGPGHHRAPARTVILAVLGGSLFGFVFVALHQTTSDSGVWPVFIMRMTSIPYLAVLLVTTRSSVRGVRTHVAPTIGSGLLDSLANWLYVLAVREGLLSVVSVVVSLYPGTTMALAVGVDRERVHRSQVFGVVLAAIAVCVIALG